MSPAFLLAARGRLALCALVLAAGCSSFVSQGNEARDRGDYASAADWYQRALADKPSDDLRQRRDDARARALELSEQAIAAARQTGNLGTTLTTLGQRAELRTRWSLGNRYRPDEERWI